MPEEVAVKLLCFVVMLCLGVVWLPSAEAQLADPIPTPIPASTIAVEIADFVQIPASDAGSTAKARINYLSPVGDGSGRLFVNDTRGQLWITDHQGSAPTLFMDLNTISGVNLTGQNAGERGFSSFAFHPDFANVGTAGYRKFFTAHSASTAAAANFDDTAPGAPNHWSVLTEWTVNDPTANSFAGTRREIVSFAQPYGNHNVGLIAFNPNAAPGGDDYGNLYIAHGDGGSGGDPLGNAQAGTSPLGKILRINPLASDTAPYTVPNDNFGQTVPTHLPEIWASGLRNPQRFSWDTEGAGQMFISDIGQNSIEEINLGIAGANYGWQPREGTFKSVLGGVDFVQPSDDAGLNFTYPVLQYDHINSTFDDSRFNSVPNRAVIGGFVYRGSLIPELRGHYIFGDLVMGTVFHAPVDQLTPDSPIAFEELRLVVDGVETTLFDLSATSNRVDLRFGIDEHGELYLLNKRDGMIRKIIAQLDPLRGDFSDDGVVDQDDLDLVLNFWGIAVTDGQAPDVSWLNPMNVTGTLVGQDELALVLQNWGNASPLADEFGAITDRTGLSESEILGLIPEPATALLIIMPWLMRRRVI